MKAAAYIRESSIEQADGYSPDMQLRAIRKYAQEHGMTLDERHIFQEFQSGRTDQRERFQDLLKAAENHEFGAVLLYHTSRFARNIADARRYKRHLRERLGVKVVSVTQAIDPSTPSGRLAEGVFELFDDNYSDQLGAWVKAGYQEKWERGGLLGNLPIGYTYELAQDGKAKRIVPDKVLAPMIRQGFELYATGEYSYKTLATWANSQGYRTMKGLPFNLFSWEVILNNPTYAGWVSYHRRREPKKHDLKPSGFEAICPLELFMKVQETRERRRRIPKLSVQRKIYLLSGLARCAYCGGPLWGQPHNGIRYLVDMGFRGQRKCQKAVKAEVIERQVLDYVSSIQLDASYETAVLNYLKCKNPGDDTEQQRSKLKVAQERLHQLFIWGDLSEVEYREQSRQLKTQLAQIPMPALLLDLREALSYMKDFKSLVEKSSPELQRKFVSEVLRQVKIKDKVVVAIEPKPAYLPLFVLDRAKKLSGVVGPDGFEPSTNRL